MTRCLNLIYLFRLNFKFYIACCMNKFIWILNLVWRMRKLNKLRALNSYRKSREKLLGKLWPWMTCGTCLRYLLMSSLYKANGDNNRTVIASDIKGTSAQGFCNDEWCVSIIIIEIVGYISREIFVTWKSSF